ncbi:hypothetical protein [Caballeronia sp. GAFFF1]|uniref:hypothetical protein n=1 Tax=Caballeronia sp. GAFFF1 TaxID=2921779 RepID=UPI002028BFBD|nr:hypothetical protein [Caballeronia sp. GAFFF1]
MRDIALDQAERPTQARLAVASRAAACLLLIAGATLAHADDVEDLADFLGYALQDGRAGIQSCAARAAQIVGPIGAGISEAHDRRP